MPSLHLYEDGTFYCYGCGVGGSLYDFAGRLWGLDTKGRAFLELRARLAETFRLRAAPASNIGADRSLMPQTGSSRRFRSAPSFPAVPPGQ